MRVASQQIALVFEELLMASCLKVRVVVFDMDDPLRGPNPHISVAFPIVVQVPVVPEKRLPFLGELSTFETLSTTLTSF
jgi:hypothetical protein